MSPPRFAIRGARHEDIDCIYSWMERDHLESGEGFWCHRDMIRAAVAQGDLYVATVGGSVVGYQLGATDVDLIQVGRSWRRLGVASALIDAVSGRAADAGKCLVHVGALEEDFWERRGFSEHVGDPRGAKTLMVLHVPTWQRAQARLSTAAF